MEILKRRSESWSKGSPARIATRSTGIHSVGKRSFKKETPGIARYVVRVETGGNGTVSDATNVLTGSQCPVNIAETKRG